MSMTFDTAWSVKDVRGYKLFSEIPHGLVERIETPSGEVISTDLLDQFTAIMRVQAHLETRVAGEDAATFVSPRVVARRVRWSRASRA